MKRYHAETAITRRHHREHLRAVHGWPKQRVDCPCDLQAGRFRKRDAYDCGNARCGVCHCDKLCGHEPTRQERQAALSLTEGVAELEDRR